MKKLLALSLLCTLAACGDDPAPKVVKNDPAPEPKIEKKTDEVLPGAEGDVVKIEVKGMT